VGNLIIFLKKLIALGN